MNFRAEDAVAEEIRAHVVRLRLDDGAEIEDGAHAAGFLENLQKER